MNNHPIAGKNYIVKIIDFGDPVGVKNYIQQSSRSITQLFYLGIDYYL